MPRIQRLPPSARKVFLLSLLVLAADGGYRWFVGTLLPATAAFNLPPQDLAVGVASLICAGFLYWLGRLRYNNRTLRNLPGSWSAASLAVLGLGVAALFLQWRRPWADFNAETALPRLGGLAAALSVAACEEIGFRGTLFLAVQEWGGKAGTFWALALGCAGFALLHGGYQSPWNLPFAAAAGLAFGVARLRGASLWSLVAAHGLMDAVDALWMSPSLTLGYWPALYAAACALGVAGLLWFLPKVDAHPPIITGR